MTRTKDIAGQGDWMRCTPEEFAKRFMTWQHSRGRAVTLRDVTSFVGFFFDDWDSDVVALFSRRMYSEVCKLIESGWETTDEAAEIRATVPRQV